MLDFLIEIMLEKGWHERTEAELLSSLPPPQYWHEPTIPVVIRDEWLPLILGRHHTAVALPFRVGGACRVFINPGLRHVNPLAYVTVVFHEVYGHCNGTSLGDWRFGHPGKGEGTEVIHDLTEFLRQFEITGRLLDEFGL